MAGLTRAEKENITSLAAFAGKKANVITREKSEAAVDERPEYQRIVKIDKKEYRVVFVVVDYLPPGLSRRVSISVEQKRPKNLIAVNLILRLLGFKTSMLSVLKNTDMVHTEIDGDTKSIVIIERIDDV